GDPFTNYLLRAGHFHGRQEFSIGQLRQALSLAADAGEFLHVVVPRRDIGIANRPIHRDAVFEVGCKVQIAPAIALAAPRDGLAADLAPANPRKMFAGIVSVGIVYVADEEFIRILIASVVTLALHVLRSGALRANVPVAILQLPDRGVLDVVLVWV